MFQTILDIIFPSRCIPCGSPNAKALCGACAALVHTRDTLLCGRCGARLPSGTKICHRNFPYLLGAATDYGDPRVRELVHGLKFRFVRSAARALGELLAASLRATKIPLASFVAIPVPLSRERERVRGFNQSLLIAEAVANALGIPLAPDALVRVRHAKPQSETGSRSERLSNVRGAFAVRGRIPGAHILLVDDVTTSGATFSEAARALRRAGARHVLAAAAAKA